MNENGTYNNCLFDNELKALFIMKDMDCYFMDYRDDLIEVEFPVGGKYPNGAYTFITLDSMQVASMVIEDDGYKSVTPLSYGFSTIIYNGYVTADTDGTEIGSTNWLKI